MKNVLLCIIVVLTVCSCTTIDDSCDRDLSGTYEGQHTCLSLSGSGGRTIRVTVAGEDGNYQVSFSEPVGIEPGDIEQDGCGFNYSSGSFGDRRTGTFEVVGDVLTYEISGNSSGATACSFSGGKI